MAITLPYADSFDSYTDGSFRGATKGDWSGANSADTLGNETNITSSAAHGTGKGVRWYARNAKNDNSGLIYTWLSSAVNEIWFRFYMRFQSGFAWSSQSEMKVIWFATDAGGGYPPVIFGLSRASCWDGRGGDERTDALYFWNQDHGDPDEGVCGSSNTGFTAINGGSTGDGLWHCYEVHWKKVDGSSDIEQVWIDGILKLDRQNLNLGTDWPKKLIEIFVNIDAPNNDPSATVDLDDIAISSNGRIGPVSSITKLQGITTIGGISKLNGVDWGSIKSVL